MEPSALLVVLQVYSLRQLFIALHIYGVLNFFFFFFCKAADVVALFIYGFRESVSCCWAVSFIVEQL